MARRTKQLPLSRTTRIRLAEAQRRAGIELDPVLGVIARRSPVSLEEVRSAIRIDVTAAFARLRRLFELQPDREIPSPAEFFTLDENDLSFFAYAGHGKGSHPILGLSAGAVLGVEELLLKCLTNPDFFSPFDELRGEGKFDTPAPIAFLRVEDERPNRYVDYEWLAKLGDDLGYALVTPLPYTPWRLAQFELLRDLAIDWLLLHEASHWIGGHLAFLRGAEKRGPQTAGGAIGLGFSDGGISMDEHPQRRAFERALKSADAPHIEPLVAHRCLEHQADYNGFTLLARLHHQQHPRASTAFARYAKTMAALDLPPPLHKIGRLSEGRRLRSMLVAAETAVLIIERSSCSEKRNAGYPLPLERFLHLQHAGSQEWPIAINTEHGVMLNGPRAGGRRIQSVLREGFAKPLLDVNITARELGLNPLIDPNVPRGAALQALTRDLLRFFDANAADDDFETDAAKRLRLIERRQYPTFAPVVARYRLYRRKPSDR